MRWKLLFFVGLVVLAIESKVTPYHFSKNDAMQRISNLTESLPNDLSKNTILVYLNPNVTSGKVYLTELDVMTLSQHVGVSTLNGYSGRTPHGHIWLETVEDVKSYISTLRANGEFSNSLSGRPVLVIYESKPNVFESYYIENEK